MANAFLIDSAINSPRDFENRALDRLSLENRAVASGMVMVASYHRTAGCKMIRLRDNELWGG